MGQRQKRRQAAPGLSLSSCRQCRMHEGLGRPICSGTDRFNAVSAWICFRAAVEGRGAFLDPSVSAEPFMEKMADYGLPVRNQRNVALDFWKKSPFLRKNYPLPVMGRGYNLKNLKEKIGGVRDAQNSMAMQLFNVSRKKLKRALTLNSTYRTDLFHGLWRVVGIEPLISSSGPGLALLLIILTPIIFSLAQPADCAGTPNHDACSRRLLSWNQTRIWTVCGFPGRMEQLGGVPGWMCPSTRC